MSAETILVVDDEPDIRDIVKEILNDEDYAVFTAENADSARQVYNDHNLDLILLDIWMPGTDGISLLKEWSKQKLETPVVMVSGHGNIETAVEATKHGAVDFLEKPLSTAKLLATVKHALQTNRLRRENVQLRHQLEPVSELVGNSTTIIQLKERIALLAKTTSWVLITGEPGCGKGVVARYLHNSSDRQNGPFIEVNLAAIPVHNVATQLFGSEEGGLIHRGRLEQASGGTLLLDEIGDLDLDTQAKLLSALDDDGKFMRIGGHRYVNIDVRILTATNQNLERAVSQGRFREDLYYRLNVLPLPVPPLRDHLGDVPELVSFYVSWMAEKENLPYREFSTTALELLGNYHWPGNVRELKNMVQRLLILNRGTEVSHQELALALGRITPANANDISDTLFNEPLHRAQTNFEKAYFQHHLRQAAGDKTALQERTGLQGESLNRKLKELGIDPH